MPRLGELESSLLEHLWAAGSATARSAHDAIGQSRGISLNTIQSTLDRLHRKGLLERSKVSRAFHYSASVTRASLLAALVAEAAVRFGEDRSTAMSALVDAAEQLDEAALDELERLIGARRAGLENIGQDTNDPEKDDLGKNDPGKNDPGTSHD